MNAVYGLFTENFLPFSSHYSSCMRHQVMLKHTVSATYTGVASVMCLSDVLDILARMNASMQRKLADFSMLPVLLKVTTD